MKTLSSVSLALVLLVLALMGGPATTTIRPAFGAEWAANAATPTDLPVVFVPGISGSALVDAQNAEYWPAAGSLSHDKLTLYPSQPHPTLHPSYAITEAKLLGVHIPYFDSETYGPLLGFFGNNGFVEYQTGGEPVKRTTAGCDLSQAANQPNLFVFPYDWRVSNAANAVALADYVGCVQKFYPGTQINLMAHSMGGLVSRRYIIDHPNDNHVNALITVGSPWLGSGKLVWTMETGEFVFFVWDSTLLNAIGSFTGAHELINSQAWYDLGGVPAIIEDGQDLNQNGIDTERYSYAQLVSYMNTFKGKEGFVPGTANQLFHTFSGPRGEQDDWNNDTTGVKYFHIAGAGGAPDTIDRVVATTLAKCLYYGSTDCDLSTAEYPKYGIGDQTVPLLSAVRDGGANGNYNAPGAVVYVCRATGANSDNVGHTALMSNPVVQNLLLQYLAQANGATPIPPPDSLTCGQGGSPTSSPNTYHQLVVDGATDLRVSDVTSPSNTAPFLKGVVQNAISPVATQLVMSSGDYTVTFKTVTGTTAIEWLYGTSATITSAVRYLDMVLEPNRSVAVILHDGAFESLRYDTDGDSVVDTALTATFALQGTPAQDVEPPSVGVFGAVLGTGVRVTVNAQDPGAGIQRLLYSLDGKHFQPYSRPFVVDPRLVRKVYAFADDSVGNRSPVRTYQLPKIDAYLPFMSFGR